MNPSGSSMVIGSRPWCIQCWCHLEVHDPRNMRIKYENSTVYKSGVTVIDKICSQKHRQTDWQTENIMTQIILSGDIKTKEPSLKSILPMKISEVVFLFWSTFSFEVLEEKNKFIPLFKIPTSLSIQNLKQVQGKLFVLCIQWLKYTHLHKSLFGWDNNKR